MMLYDLSNASKANCVHFQTTIRSMYTQRNELNDEWTVDRWD